MKKRPVLSVVIISYNEEKVIAQTLESVKWADEIVIVDSGSTDLTLDICRKYTDRIFERKMTGFGEQKNWGISKTEGSWILSLDSDEVVSPALKDRILVLMEGEKSADGYEIKRTADFMGRWIMHGAWGSDYQLRLFKKEKGQFNESVPVHEGVLLSGTLERLEEPLMHYTYRNFPAYLKKLTDYAYKDAVIWRDKKRKFHDFYIFYLPLQRFYFDFFRNRGFMDGLEGFLLSVFSAYYVFLKFLKVRELIWVPEEDAL